MIEQRHCLTDSEPEPEDISLIAATLEGEPVVRARKEHAGVFSDVKCPICNQVLNMVLYRGPRFVCGCKEKRL